MASAQAHGGRPLANRMAASSAKAVKGCIHALTEHELQARNLWHALDLSFRISQDLCGSGWIVYWPSNPRVQLYIMQAFLATQNMDASACATVEELRSRAASLPPARDLTQVQCAEQEAFTKQPSCAKCPLAKCPSQPTVLPLHTR